MGLFKCIVDNQFDGTFGYRRGQIYTFSANPNASLFEAISAGQADTMPVGGTSLPAHKDIEDDWHVHDDVQFKANTQVSSFATATTDVSGDYGVGPLDTLICVTAGTSDKTITLPSASSSTGRIITVSKVDNGGGNVIVVGTIKGESSLTIEFQYSAATLQSNGSEWVIR